ncbi:MAG: TIGR00341 family protein [Phycisphaerales bacterium]|nr:TIGR00341 family protein [Phycisphaerales bacterium]
MPLRVLQIILPADHHEDLCVILDDAQCNQRWITPLNDDLAMTSAVLRSESVEPITDTLRGKYENTDGFRTILHDIEATYPRLPEPEDEPTPDKESDTQHTGWKTRFGRVSREELQEDIQDSAKITPVYLSMVSLATIVACVGLLKDSAPIIIGAMVIAPLLGPNTALALGTTLGDLSMIKNAIKSNIVGLGIAIIISIAYGYFGVTDDITNEIITRTKVDTADIVLALASGAAGVVAFTTGASAVLVGVMVAVALLPPTATCGMLIGSGQHAEAAGAAVLAATNIVCINLSSAAILIAQGVRPTTWYDKGRAKKATVTALITWTIALATLAALILYFW